MLLFMGALFSSLAAGLAESGLTGPESAYVPMRVHPDLFGRTMKAEWFEPEFLRIIETARNGSKEDVLQLLRHETEGVYSFPMLKPHFCQMILDEVDSYQRSGLPIRRPNSMNNCATRERSSAARAPRGRRRAHPARPPSALTDGLIVNEIGMRPFITALQQQMLCSP